MERLERLRGQFAATELARADSRHCARLKTYHARFLCPFFLLACSVTTVQVFRSHKSSLEIHWHSIVWHRCVLVLRIYLPGYTSIAEAFLDRISNKKKSIKPALTLIIFAASRGHFAIHYESKKHANRICSVMHGHMLYVDYCCLAASESSIACRSTSVILAMETPEARFAV